MMFPVHMMPDNVDPVKYFDKLSKWEEFYYKGNIPQKNKVFRWIAFMYDKESPFRNKIPDANKRKVEIAKYVRMVTDANKVEDWVLKVLSAKNAQINRMVIAYVRMHRYPKYALTVGLENQFYTDLELTYAGKSLTGKRSLTVTQQELEQSMIDLLNGDNNQSMHDSLFAVMEEERLSNFTPEGVAMALESGEDIFATKNKEEEISYDDD